MPLRRCLSCNALTQGSRCGGCRRAADRKRNAERPHYQGDYRRRADQAKAVWHATQAGCWICGGALDPHLPWPDPLSTTADHVRPGDPTSPLRPAHLRCYSSRGNRDDCAEPEHPGTGRPLPTGT